MKITQDPQFQPIKIVINTAEEAEVFWAYMRGETGQLDHRQRESLNDLRNDISNWFSNHAQLGGNGL